MGRESQDVVKMGIELIVGSLLMFLVVGIVIMAHTWFQKEEYRKYQTQYQTENAKSWTFQSVADKRGHVTGSDVVDFIVRNSSKYEYVIGTGQFTSNSAGENHVSDTQVQAIGTNSFVNPATGERNTDIIKTYKFSDKDILKTNVEDIKEDDGNTRQDGEPEKSGWKQEYVNESGSTGVRVYGKDLIQRRMLSGREGTDIYSERYLTKVASMNRYLGKSFRILYDTNNGEIIRWYFLMDKEQKSESEVR